jgi:hypothetical protein
MLSASFPQPDWFLDKIVTASAAQLFYVSSLDRKQAAGIWSVFVNAAEARAIGSLLEERTLKEQLAARAATVAFTASQSQGLSHFLFAKICVDEAANLTLCLPCTQLSILDRTGTKPVRQSLFEGALPCYRSRTK